MDNTIEIARRLDSIGIPPDRPHRKEAEQYAENVLDEFKGLLEDENYGVSFRDILITYFESALETD